MAQANWPPFPYHKWCLFSSFRAVAIGTFVAMGLTAATAGILTTMKNTTTRMEAASPIRGGGGAAGATGATAGGGGFDWVRKS